MYTKFFSFLAAVCLTAAFTACDSGEYEYHSTGFYPTSSGKEIFADQTIDSVRVVSYDSWSLTNDCPWMKISSNGQYAPLQVEVKPGTAVSTRLDLEITPNLTNEIRTDFIRVKSSFGKIGTVSKRITQYPYINIIQPDVNVIEKDGKKVYVFDKLVSYRGKESNDAKPTLTFIVYSATATLTSDQEWIQPVQTKDFKTSERVKVELDVQPNTTGKARFATLTLSSNGVSTPISVTQGANPKK